MLIRTYGNPYRFFLVFLIKTSKGLLEPVAKKVDEEGRKVGDSVHGSLQQLSWSNYLKIYPRPVYCIVSNL